MHISISGFHSLCSMSVKCEHVQSFWLIPPAIVKSNIENYWVNVLILNYVIVCLLSYASEGCDWIIFQCRVIILPQHGCLSVLRCGKNNHVWQKNWQK